MNLKEAQKMFVGKRVRIKDAAPKTTWKSNHDIVGILSFLDYNQNLPEWKITAVVSNYPIKDVDLDKISLEPEYKKIFDTNG
jgi:hypothetical protein